MTNFLVQHNQPLSIADDLGPLFRNIFTDSQIAKAYASGRTKTTCLMQLLHTLQVSIVVPIVIMQSIYFFYSFTCGSKCKMLCVLFFLVHF